MLLLVNNIELDIFKKLQLQVRCEKNVAVENINAVLDESGTFFIETTNVHKECIECYIINLSENEIWFLDAVQEKAGISREKIQIIGSELFKKQDDENSELYAYFKNKGQSKKLESYIEKTSVYIAKEHQLRYCDVFLMIPGFLKDNDVIYKESIGSSSDDFCNLTQQRLEEEIEESFVKDIDRYYLGDIDLVIDSDIVEKEEFVQNAALYLLRHNISGFCILEIRASYCLIGGNKLNNYYCGNGLIYRLNDCCYSYDELLKLFHIEPFGKKRSLIFSYNSINKREIVNALANEEYVMGEIKGEFAKLAEKDIALYDTANVYVSTTTMLEHCKDFPNNKFQRIIYQSIELFFVELLLLQDASVDKIYKELNYLQNNQTTNKDYESAIEKLEYINEELSNALVFSDYDYFCFPTTRMSAQNIAKAFGLNAIYEKYNQSLEILKGLMQANKRKNEKKQDRIKNKFLFLLTSLSAIATFGEIINLSMNSVTPLRAYILAASVILLIYSIYKLLIWIGEKHDRKTSKRDRKTSKSE